MDEALRFFRTYEIWIYLLLGFGILLYIRRFYIAWQDIRGTIFGLERNNAQSRLSQATTVIILLILMVVGEFVIVAYIAPLRPEATPLLTPTLDLISTATTTLTPAETGLPGLEPPPEGETPVPSPTFDARIGNCLVDSVEITSPEPGDTLIGEVSIGGSADIANFGFYKLEVTLQSELNWRTIQAGRDPIRSNVLVEKWDTSTLVPGDYLLRLVVTDNDGTPLPDCQVPVKIATEN